MSLITIQTEDARIVIESIRPSFATLEATAEALSVERLDERFEASEGLSIPAPRFTKIAADGTRLQAGKSHGMAADHVAVLDHSTGLMWSVESLGDPGAEDDGISQEACAQRCAELRLLGHDDWRLPTRAELVALIDDTRHEPAIDTDFFPRVKPRWHWTSTPAAWSSASAWYVSFYGGSVLSLRRDYDGFALAVRRAGQ